MDKVDLLIGPYATNMVAPAIPVLMQFKKTTIGILATPPTASSTTISISRCCRPVPSRRKHFHSASSSLRRGQAATEDGCDRRRRRRIRPERRRRRASEIKEIGGFEIVSDLSYPPSTADYTPIMRAVKALDPDIVYVAAYPPDSVGIVRAANEIGLTPKMFGGTFIGLLVTPIKMQLGPLINGIVNNEVFLPSPLSPFPARSSCCEVPGHRTHEGIDPIGWAFPPLGYAAGQVLAQAVEGTKSLDHVDNRRLHAQPQLQHRRRRDHLRQGRRMDEIARRLHTVPARHAATKSINSRTPATRSCYGRASISPAR